MDEFEQELKNGFLDEAVQLLSEAEQCFLTLEANPNDVATLEKIFRIAHNIKGSSKAVGFDSLGAFTHEFESFMLKCKSGQIPITPDVISLFLKCNDHIRLWLHSLRADHGSSIDNEMLISEIKGFSEPEPVTEVIDEGPVEIAVAVASEMAAEEIETPLEASAEPFVPEPIPEEPQNSDSEEIKFEEIALLAQASLKEVGIEPEVVQLKPAPTPNPVALPEEPTKAIPASAIQASTPTTVAVSDESIRVSLARLEKLLNFVGEIVILQTVLKEQAYSNNAAELRKTVQQMGKVTKEVQDLSMSLRMVPLKQTFQKMQRIVRDTSSILGKKVNLVVEGDETEVDKTVLESLSDPLVHLIRNAVDHGIETPDIRTGKGKHESGKIVLKAYHQSGKLVIEIKDDGGGIPAEKLKQKALEKGILKPGQTLTEQEAIHLIFHPGFSTKAQVTEVSGRGVVMDVVKTNIEQMSGEVLVETVANQGSTFKIILPLTLAIIDGMIVKIGADRFVIPLSHVHESVKPAPDDIKRMTGVGEVLLLRGENLPLFRLSKHLRLAGNQTTLPNEKIAIIVRIGPKPFAVMVDDIIGQHQVVIKKIGAEIQYLSGYSGSAILGDGKPALILELPELLSTQKSNHHSPRKAAA